MSTKYGYIDASGRVAIAPMYDDARFFRGGLALVQVGAQASFIDPDGREVFRLPADTHTEGFFSEGLALARVGGRTGIHEADGGLWGYIDCRGKFAIPAQFAIPTDQAYDFSMNSAGMFSEGLAAMIAPDGRWGYIDRTGRWAIPPRFVEGQPFYQGVAKVILFRRVSRVPDSHYTRVEEETWGYIDRGGKVLWRSKP